MTELLIIEYKNQLVADSREVAKIICKRHDNLIRNIATYNEYLGDLNFEESDFFIKRNYLNSQNKKQPMYYLTKKGCDMVANKMTGKKGVLFTALYINRFYEMENALQSKQAARLDFPQFTDAISEIHDKPAPYHYSNECDLINRLVLGMTAKQYREIHGLKKGESIRPHLSAKNIALVDGLQRADIGLMISERDFKKRKMFLEWYLNRMIEKQKRIAC